MVQDLHKMAPGPFMWKEGLPEFLKSAHGPKRLVESWSDWLWCTGWKQRVTVFASVHVWCTFELSLQVCEAVTGLCFCGRRSENAPFLLRSPCETTPAASRFSGRALISIYMGCLLLQQRDDSYLTLICLPPFVAAAAGVHRVALVEFAVWFLFTVTRFRGFGWFFPSGRSSSSSSRCTRD